MTPAREIAALKRRIRALERDRKSMQRRISESEVLIARGIDLMPLEQLSKWRGVRAWQENL